MPLSLLRLIDKHRFDLAHMANFLKQESLQHLHRFIIGGSIALIVSLRVPHLSSSNTAGRILKIYIGELGL